MIFTKNTKVPITSQVHKAFTLVEVLITITIIGVVAAITIPAMLNKTNDREIITQLKKNYSVLSSATSSIEAEEGPIGTWNWDESGYSMDEVVANYKKHLNFTKTCGFNVNTCYLETNWKALNKNSYFSYFLGGNAYYNILQDGTFVKFQKCLTTGCEFGQLVSTGLTTKMTIIVNLNGEKAPNIVGRDIFIFALTQEKGLIAPDFNVDNRCRTIEVGLTCSTKILKEDAINY